MGAGENYLQRIRHPHGMDPESLADSTLLKPRTETFWCLHRSVARVRVCVSAFCGGDASCRCRQDHIMVKVCFSVFVEVMHHAGVDKIT